MFDIKNLFKSLETQQLYNQMLYSIAIEKEITEEDINKLYPSDDNDTLKEYSINTYKTLILSLTHDEQKEYLKWTMSIRPYIENILNSTTNMENDLCDEIEKRGLDQLNDIEKIATEKMIDMYNSIFSNLRNAILELDANIFKKFSLQFLNIDFNVLLNLPKND